MEILVYLAELIQHRKQVGIAGLGTVYKSKIPGRYDAEAHAFLPPSHALHFSTELLENDALAEYISFKRNISIDSARYYIEEFSNKAVQELSENNETQLGKLGKLSSVEGSIVFETAENGNLQYFGLPRVNEDRLPEGHNIEPLKIEQAEDDFVENFPDAEKDEEAENQAISEKIEEVVEENRLEEENPGLEYQNLAAMLPTEINHTTSDEIPQQEKESRNSASLKIVLTAVLVLVILGLAYFLYPKMIKDNKEALQESQIHDSSTNHTKLGIPDSIAYTDSVKNTALDAEANLADTQAIASNTVPPPVVEKPSVTTYEIIIGSLANMKEAKKFVAQIKSKGINGWIVDSLASGKKRVSIASFTDWETATKERRRIVKELKDPSIYIYTNKPKR